MLNDFKRILPGGQLSAAEINRLFEAVMALSELQVASPLRLDSGHLGQGYALSVDGLAGNPPFLAKLTSETSGFYAWTEQYESGHGTLADVPSGRSGTATVNPARDINGTTGIATGTIVLLWPTLGFDNASSVGSEFLFSGAATSLSTTNLTLSKYLAINYLSATISSNQNDYNFSSTGKLYANVTSAANITGLAAGVDGQLLIIWNAGNANLSFTNQDAASAAANRIITPSGSTYVLYPNNGVILEYSGTKSRWVFDSPDVFLASGATATTGLVPQPSLSAGTTKFLREDATWQVPSAPAFSGARVYNSAAESIPNNAITNITFDSILYDTSSYFTAGNNFFTAPKTGYYLVGCCVEWASNTTGYRYLEIGKGGGDVVAADDRPGVVTTATYQHVSTVIKMNANDTVQFRGIQTSGGSLNILQLGTTDFSTPIAWIALLGS